MSYKTIQVRFEKTVCFIQIYRPEANNAINECMISEIYQVLELCKESVTIVVLEGLPNVFCFGADFQELHEKNVGSRQREVSPEQLYDLWLNMATGPYTVVSHVRGRTNAGGMGFVAASDMVIADKTAQFSLSELLFGLFPACVLPFLIRRIGFQKAHYLTLSTQPINVEQAYSWGLVDAYDEQSESILRKHLLRLKCLSKAGISRYKRYMSTLYEPLLQSRPFAIEANREIFSDQSILEGISRYVEKGIFPWKDK